MLLIVVCALFSWKLSRVFFEMEIRLDSSRSRIYTRKISFMGDGRYFARAGFIRYPCSHSQDHFPFEMSFCFFLILRKERL